MTGYTLLSNNRIVESVYKTYKIKNLISSMIDYSIKDRSNQDLEQYIYLQLLQFENIRLNTLYQSDKLRNFISQIIKNQRNGNTEYQNTRIKETNQVYDLTDEETYDTTIDIIIDYIDLRSEMCEGQTYTPIELKYILSFTILKKYFLSDLTQMELADHLNLSRSTINTFMNFAKKDVLKYWKKKGQFI